MVVLWNCFGNAYNKRQWSVNMLKFICSTNFVTILSNFNELKAKMDRLQAFKSTFWIEFIGILTSTLCNKWQRGDNRLNSKCIYSRIITISISVSVAVIISVAVVTLFFIGLHVVLLLYIARCIALDLFKKATLLY